MHKVSICQSILETLESELEQDQLQNVCEVHMKIGILSCVDTKILEHAFNYIIEDSPLKNADSMYLFRLMH